MITELSITYKLSYLLAVKLSRRGERRGDQVVFGFKVCVDQAHT